MDTTVLPPNRWARIFVLLSLDRVDPVLAHMGLDPAERPRRKATLRQLILENRAAHAANPGKAFDLADRVLLALTAQEGEAAARALYDWATGVFTEAHEDQPHWSAWSILFNSTPFLSRARSEGALSPERLDLVGSQLDSFMNLRGFREEVLVAKGPPLSEWDLEMYALHGMSEEDEIADPFSLVQLVVEIHRIQQFFGWLTGRLTLEEKDALTALGQRMIGELGIWMPEPLAHPDRMPRVP